MDAAEAIDLFGWRQGAFLPEILRPKLTGGVGANLSPSDTVICVTQSCDVIHGDFEAEPSAEFAALRKVDPTQLFNGDVIHGACKLSSR